MRPFFVRKHISNSGLLANRNYMTGFRSEIRVIVPGRARPPFHGGIQSRLPCKCKKTQDMRAQRGHSRARIAPAFFTRKKGFCVPAKADAQNPV